MHDSLLGTKTRHLAIQFGENKVEVNGGKFAINSDEVTCKHVRSLHLLNSNKKKIEFLHIAIDLQKFTLLRVLHFLRFEFEGRKIPKGIGNLIHLRYLRFEKCEFDKVPSSIRNLSYLQSLHLSTSRVVRVPNVLKKLGA